MVDSKCHSSEESNLFKAFNRSFFTRFRLRSGSFKPKESHVGTVEFAAVDLTHIYSLTSTHHETQTDLPSPETGTESDDTDLVSQLQGSGDSPVASISEDLSAIPHIITDSETPVERGRARVRRRGPGKTGVVLKGPVSPDRFIPARQFGYSPSTPFRVSKIPQQLSPEEKLRRRRPPSADPFMPSRPRRSAETSRVQRPAEPRRSPRYGPHFVNDSAAVGSHTHNETSDFLRQISSGAVWNVGGSSAVLGRPPAAVPDGTGGLLGSGTTAPMYVAKFLKKPSASEDREKFESRIALALDIDLTTRLLGISTFCPLLESSPSPSSPDYEQFFPFSWKDNAWKRVEKTQWPPIVPKDHGEIVPSRPFRVLEAPRLRDDFYCSALAYCPTSGILAVGLAHEVYLWSEHFGVQCPPFNAKQHPSNYVTSLSFSSENGGRSILAVGQQHGLLVLWSTLESNARFEIIHPNSISCVAFKQTTTRRLSERFPNMEVDVEDLAVGDELGYVWYYSIEWPDPDSADWGGSIILLAKIAAHTQQICGLAWSPDDAYLATGGNDNACLLFELCEIISLQHLGVPSQPLPSPQSPGTRSQNAFSCLSINSNPRRLFSRRNILSHLLPSWAHSDVKLLSPSILKHPGSFISGGGRTAMVPSNRQKHRLEHSAAVKAIAFAPWQPSLLATGGGSNDRAIHFYHTQSGACLATINVYAQVTSLIWSKTRPEIVATFGYAQPEHPIRIAVFAWPSCEQIAAIPWGPRGSSVDGGVNESTGDCGRALWAVSFPGGPYRLTSDLCETSATATDNGRGRNEHCRRKTALAVVRPKEKEGGLWCSRTLEEGCIIVASSDQTVKFHEVWSGPRRTAVAATGLLGGSDILEELEGIENPGREIIR